MEELEKKDQQVNKEEVREETSNLEGEVKPLVSQKRKVFLLAGFGVILLTAVSVLAWQMSQPKRTVEFRQPLPTALPTILPTVIKEEVDEATKKLETQGTSDEIGEIEKDLNLTELENLDQELNLLETEIFTP